MRVLIPFFVFLFIFTPIAHAVFINDSEIIDTSIPEPGDALEDTEGEEDSGSEATIDDIFGDDDEEEDGGSGDEDTVTVVVETDGGSGSDGDGSGGSEETTITITNGSEGSTQTITELVETLFGDGGGVTLGSSGAGSGASGSGGLYINAENVHASLEERGSLRALLRIWDPIGRTNRTGGSLSQADLGLIAASTALRDASFEDVFFGVERFELTYKSRAYVLAIIPTSMRVKLAIDPAAVDASRRVEVRLPWWQFFARKFVSQESLVADIGAIVVTESRKEGESAADSQARMFNAVVTFLRLRHDTVDGSF